MGVDAVGVLRVEVTDNGAGIALENQKKVFGEFTQFNKNELQGGGRYFLLWCVSYDASINQVGRDWACGFLEG